MKFPAFVISFLFLAAACYAQQRPGDDVLRPVPTRVTIGPFVGAAYNFSLGRPVTQCHCEYPGGDGGGGLFGLTIDYPLASNVAISGSIGFYNLYTSYSKFDQRLIPYGSDPNIEYTFVNVGGKADISMHVMEIAITGKWYTGRKPFYVFGGPVFGFVLYDHLLETETIQSPGFVYYGTSSARQVFFDDGLKNIYSAATFRLAVAAGVGYDFAIAPRWSLSPEIVLSLPVLPVTSSVPHWRIGACRFLVALKYAM